MLFGLLWPSVVLDSVTVCCGNVYLEQATRNALYTVELAGRSDVPVYAGAPRPLVRDLIAAHYVHGPDGMGDAKFPEPTLSLKKAMPPTPSSSCRTATPVSSRSSPRRRSRISRWLCCWTPSLFRG